MLINGSTQIHNNFQTTNFLLNLREDEVESENYGIWDLFPV